MESKTAELGGNYLFVGGVPRSGTTLLQRIMGAHPKVYAGPEFDFIPAGIMALRERMRTAIEVGRISEIVDEETLDVAFRDFLHRIFQEKLKREDREIFCEKTPASALFFPELIDLFPESHFVVVIRDPRDVANSMRVVRNKAVSQKKRPPRFVRSVAASVEEMNQFFQAIDISARKSDRVHLVHYEDILQNPETEIRRVCDLIGLEFSGVMLEIEKAKFATSLKGDDEWYSQDALKEGIGKGGVISEGVLSRKDIDLIEKYVQDFDFLHRYDLKPGTAAGLDPLFWLWGKFQKQGLFLPRKLF